MSMQEALNSLKGDFLLLGAGGKMGVGIGELLLDTLAHLALETGKFSKKMTLVDPSTDGLVFLRNRLLKRGRSIAEKEITQVRKKFLEGTSNQEVVENFVQKLLDPCLFERGIDGVKDETLVFEAAKEDEKLKLDLFSALSKKLSPETLYFTNTSSIPVQRLEAPIRGKLAGLHFYNPPPHQSIVEVVIPKGASPHFSPLIDALLKGWKKERVEAPDIPGFIGNGYLLPELEGAFSLLPKSTVEKLNSIARDDLGRPMGIFELADFVGHDVIIAIAKVMGKERFPLILSLLPTLPASQKGKVEEVKSEEMAIAHVRANQDPLVKEFLNMSRKVCLDLIQTGVDEKGLERVLKGGFRHPFVPWDKRLTG